MVSTGLSTDHLSPVWSHLTTFQPVRAEGVYYYDAEGNAWLDFTSGIGVVNTGHCHPRVVAAIQRQAATLIHGQMNVVISPAAVELSHELNAITPSSIDSFFFSNSGAEATEGAVKLARHVTKRQNIITFQGSFHGRTALTMAMTNSKTVYRAGYQPLPGGTFVAPYPASYTLGMSDDDASDYALEQLKLLFKSQSAPEETAALVIEPILGEGGYVPAPIKFMQAARELCAHYGIMFVADEVQTGFGRTGQMFAFEQAALEPDIIIMAKGLGSGFPISAVAAPRTHMEKWQVGSHGGTYGGNALACATAAETIRVLVEEKLPENAACEGERLMRGLEALQSKHPQIGDVRGRGLMIGVEFTQPDGSPDKASAKAVQKACIEQRLLLLTCGTHENVIRWIPPLVVNDAQIDAALAVFSSALDSSI